MNYTGHAPIRQPVAESSEHDISPSCLDRSHAGTRRRINCLSHFSHSAIPFDFSRRNLTAIVECGWAPPRSFAGQTQNAILYNPPQK
jgi:hypothetical protein